MIADLEVLVEEELIQKVDARVSDMAAAIAARHPDAARAVLFYGSCLREAQFDGLMLDFYLIVSDYGAAYDRRWLAIANTLIPPNVFPFFHNGMSAKYAVLSESDFAKLCGLRADNVSVWARFSQPSRLVWTANEKSAQATVKAISEAAVTLFEMVMPLGNPPQGKVSLAIMSCWERAFALTYRCELRAERSGRATRVIEPDPARYEAFGRAALAELAFRHGVIGSQYQVSLVMDRQAAERRWRRLRRRGKWLSVLRLAKASFTFAGGIDYLAWKINRHAGTNIVITPWQRRHPLLASLMLVPRLFATRAIG